MKRCFIFCLYITIVLTSCKQKVYFENSNPSDGCSIPFENPASNFYKAKVAEAEREYIISIPQNYKSNIPHRIIFIWHSLNQKIQNIYPTQLENLADDKTIFVYPQGLNYMGLGLGWYVSKESIDIKFFDYLYDKLTSEFCIDKSRVFSSGHSFGAIMTNSLSCFRSNKIRAHSSFSGANFFNDTECKSPANRLMGHGKLDKHLIVNYNVGLKAFNFWKLKNNCGTETIIKGYCTIYSNCSKDLTWCAYPGTHRKWENADSLTWDYFKKF